MATADRIGRYQVVRELGRGGGSTVYLAIDPILHREVALKVLPHHLAADEALVRRLMREARIAASLAHPNILDVYDIEEADGLVFIKMEYVAGMSLGRLMKDYPQGLEPSRAIGLVLQVASALEYAHLHHVVHRDVKPGNILIDNNGRARLSDFGLALAADAPAGDITTATGGAFVGTPGYIAPEIILGQSVDERADLYSAGVLLFELLTGRRPHAGESPTAVLFKTVNEKAPRPSSIRPELPADLDDVVLWAIAPAPSARIPSATVLIRELSRVTGAVSTDEQWPFWSDSIRSALLRRGKVRPPDLVPAVPASHVALALERFGRENVDLELEQKPDGSLSLAGDRERLLAELNAAWTALLDLPQPPSFGALLYWEQASFRDLSDLFIRIVHLTAIALGCSYRPLGAPRGDEDVFPTTFVLDTGAAFRGTLLPPSLPLVFLVGRALDETDVQALRELLRQRSRHYFALVFVVGDAATVARARDLCDQSRLYGYDVVVLDVMEVSRIIASREPTRALRRILLSQVNLVTVSPFVTSGPVPDHVFFGRETVLRDITAEARAKSYAIVGGRRIGKSSLLARLFRTHLPAAGYLCLYHDCSSSPNFESFWAAPAEDWSPSPTSPIKGLTLGQALTDPGGASDARQLVLLLDEADKLVPQERVNGAWPVFNKLRSLASSGRAQVVLAGERALLEAIRDARSPLFNFPNEVVLGRLGKRAVEELVTVSMRQLEIELPDANALVDEIWLFTSGHPNIVQRLCKRLVERLNERPGARSITSADVREIVSDRQFLEDDFLRTYWERASALERMLCLLLARSPGQAGRLSELAPLLEAEGIKCRPATIRGALDRLVELRSILRRTDGGYAFGVESFPKVASQLGILDDLLLVTRSECLEDPEDQGEK